MKDETAVRWKEIYMKEKIHFKTVCLTDSGLKKKKKLNKTKAIFTKRCPVAVKEVLVESRAKKSGLTKYLKSVSGSTI